MVTIPNRKSALRVTVQVHWRKSTTSRGRATSKLTGQESAKYLASTNIFLVHTKKENSLELFRKERNIKITCSIA